MRQSKQVIINGSAHELPLPDNFFHTVCTSPPYYSLRRYAGAQDVDWPAMEYAPMPGLPLLTVEAMRCPLGLEPTPEAYIGHLVLVFRDVSRTLRQDGVCWIVMGDSFSSGGGPEPAQTKWQVEGASDGQANGQSRRPPSGLQQGDLMMIPHRFALALQADGWTVRNDVVWHKKAPMPESVAGWRWERHRVKVAKSNRAIGNYNAAAFPDAPQGAAHQGGIDGSAHWSDCPGCPKCEATDGYVLRRGSWRHTRAHEYVFMLTRGMGYYADQERVREELAGYERKGGTATWECDGATTHGIGSDSLHQMSRNGRNPRSVLGPRPSNYPGAHYAVYPPDLIAPLLRATAPTRTCPMCGMPWAPAVERTNMVIRRSDWGDDGNAGNRTASSGTMLEPATSSVVDYRSTCSCPDHEPVPGWVLDPFAGTFTTGEESAEMGVNCVGVDISPQYLDDHAKPRIGMTPSGALENLPLFEMLD